MDQTDPLFSPIIRELHDNYGGVSFENFADMILEKGSFQKKDHYGSKSSLWNAIGEVNNH